MLVMKFGGTSVANADRIAHAAALVVAQPGPVVVVTSAMAGVTDELIRLGHLARDRRADEVDDLVDTLRARHREAADAATEPGPARTALLLMLGELESELEQLVQGVQLLRELSPQTAALLATFGERLNAPILAAAVSGRGRPAAAVDARRFIVVNDAFGPPAVDMPLSREKARQTLLPRLAEAVPIVTGFIASTPYGGTTTLGRGGSDYSATLVGAFLDADEIWIWTDVDGVMTADPRVVPEARVLDAISYREAAEMAYFGSKVLHPRAMIPAVDRKIPVIIRSSLNPDHQGTRITEQSSETRFGVKAVTSVSGLALVTVEGNGMIGVPGVARRVFGATARLDANVYMVSQASSEHNISLIVQERDGDRVVIELEREFELEISRRQIDHVSMQPAVGIVAAIGEGMRGTPGISQRMFTALGRGRINVLAIAQGSSELNLSVAVRQDDLMRAVGATHSRFGLTRDTHLLLLGKGLVGREILRQIGTARRRLATEHGIGLNVTGVCGSRELLFDPAGLDDAALLRIADGEPLSALGGEPRPEDAEIFARLARSRWLDVVVVDVTASNDAAMHVEALEHGFHVVTANKKPMSGPLAMHDLILETAARHGLAYHFETTFGAGLPALSTLRDLVGTCDTIHRITGCFSGTLGFICAAVEDGRAFSEAVIEAKRRGYTEPDPRDDLSGLDVARKALIIARQIGARLEMEDVELEPLVPPALASAPDADAFLARLPELDAAMARRAEEARAEGCVLRYLARITAERVEVGLSAVPRDTAAGQLKGPENILVFETERYDDQPLVIRGPGAGAAVTAAGVIGDVLKIVRAS